MKETAAEKASDRIDREERIEELDQNRHKHRNTECEDHHVASAERSFRAQTSKQCQSGSDSIERGQQQERNVTQWTFLIDGLGANLEKTSGEKVHNQRDDEKHKYPETGPQHISAQTAPPLPDRQ